MAVSDAKTGIIKNNPLIFRFACSLFKAEKVGVLIGCYLVFLFAYLALIGESSDFAYGVFLFIEYVLLWIVAPYMVGTSLQQEISLKNIDFFRSLPLSPMQTSVGLLVGRNLLVFLLAGINYFPFFLAACGCQELQEDNEVMNTIFNHTLYLLSGSYFLTSVSLAVSFKFALNKANVSNAFLLLVGIMAIFFSTPIMASEKYEELNYYFINTRISILFALVSLFFGALNHKCVLRLIAFENSPAMTFGAALKWFIGGVILTAGFFIADIADKKMDNLLTMFLSYAGLAVYFILISLKNYDQYWQQCCEIKLDFSPSKSLILFVRRSNLAMTLVYLFFSLLPAVIMSVISGRQINGYIEYCVFVFMSFVFSVLLVDISVLCKQKLSKIGILFTAIFLIYLFLPSFLESGCFDGGSSGSVFGFMSYLGDRNYQPGSDGFYLFFWSHVIAILFFLGIYISNVKSIIDLRKSMLK